MKRNIFSVFFLHVILVMPAAQGVFAQSKVVNYLGKIKIFGSSGKLVEAPALPEALRIAFKGDKLNPNLLKRATDISQIIFEAPAINPLIGFNVVPDVAIVKLLRPTSST